MQKYGIIYKIQNKVNKKVYIGITTKKRGFLDRYSAKGIGIERVYNFYLYQKKNNQFYNIHLLNSINKYGFDNFTVDEEFEVCYSKEELKRREVELIKKYKSNNYKYGYNRTEGGDNFLKGEENPRYNSITLKCDYCGKEFERNKARINRSEYHFCSPKCRKAGMVGKNTGEQNHAYASIKIKCICCGKEFLRKPSQIYKHNYCSEKCRNEYQRNFMKGSNNPNWGNGVKVSGAKNGRAKKVICITTGEIFDCIKYGSEKYNIYKGGIVACCTGKQKTAGSLPNGIPLKWEYYKECI